jgi:hypothetical protein
MKIDRETLLKRLHGETHDRLTQRILSYLSDDSTRLISDKVNKVRVSEAKQMWKLRLETTEITGLTLHGAKGLIHELEGLHGQRTLEQFAFVNARTAGNLFFDGPAPHRFIGGVLIDSDAELAH